MTFVELLSGALYLRCSHSKNYSQGPGPLSNQIVYNYLLCDALFIIRKYLINSILVIIDTSH